jgi:TonB family protein
LISKLRISNTAALIGAFWSLGAFSASGQVSNEAQTAPAILKPVWATLPDGASLADRYPERAQRMGVSGRAKIRCTAAEDGALNGCEVLEEFPRGFGFGDATLRIAHFFRLRATDQYGLSVAGRQVVIPMRWKTDQPGPGAVLLAPTRRLLNLAAAPSKAQIDAAYPASAKGLGFVALRCVATSSGTLTGCVVVSETLLGQGFASAGLKLVPLFRAGPRSDGAPLEGSQVEVSLPFYPPTDAQWGDGAH